MKHLYALLIMSFVGGSLFAQRVNTTPWNAKLSPFEKQTVKPLPYEGHNGTAKIAGDTVFYDDMTNGLAGNNGVGSWTTSGPDGALWLFDTDGPNGDFSDPSEHINSDTWDTGFMIFDSNLSNDGCTNTSTCVVRDGYLESPVLDLSATPFVHLQYQQKLRWCCSAAPGHFVEISSDGGVTWNTQVFVAEGINVNQDIGTYTVRVNLAAGIAADPSNVKIRFAHLGSSSGNITHYHWQIDDVSIVESEANDLKMVTAQFDDHIPGQLSDNLEYSVYPFSQLREFTMKARIRNEGSVNASNAKLTADVVDGSNTTVFLDSNSIALFPAGANDSISIGGFTPPSVEGPYTVSLNLSSDSLDTRPDDNMFTTGFSVSEFYYASDDGARSGVNDNDDEAYYIGNLFFIENSVDLYAIRIALASGAGNTDAGVTVGGILMDANFDPVEYTETYDVASSDLSATGQARWIDLLFSSPVTLNAGEEYLVVLEHFGGTENAAIATSGTSVPFASFLYDPTTVPDPTWFYTTNTPMVRMNFDATVGINENDRVNGVGLGQNYPNPTNTMTTIPYDLTEAGNVSLQVLDLSGKVVLRRDEGQRGIGAYRIQLDTTPLSEGAYFYTLTTNGVQVTKKMTVVH